MPYKCKFGNQKELHDPKYFSVKKRSWDKASYCATCGVFVRGPTHKKFNDLFIASTNEGNPERYYDVKGKQVDVQILLPVRQARQMDPKTGEFIKMIDELTSTVRCPCCHSDCRAGPKSKTKSKKHYEKSPDPIGRPTGPDKNKEQIDEYARNIINSKNTIHEKTLEEVPEHLQKRVKRRIDKINEGKESNSDN